MRDRFRARAPRREIFLKKGKPDGQECAARVVLRFHIEYAMRNEWVCLRLSTWKTLRGSFNLKYAGQTDRAEQGVVKSQRVLDFILSRLG